MTDVVIHDLDQAVVEALRAQAQNEGRSLEEAARQIITEVALRHAARQELVKVATETARRAYHPSLPSVAEMIAEDRAR